MKLPWRVEKKAQTPSDELVEQIKQLLFPPLKVQETVDEVGERIKFHIDYSIDSNLDAALMDLQDGHNDQATQKTLNTIVKRLNNVRRLLEAYPEIDKEAKYIIVDDGSTEDDVEAATDR